MRNGQSLNLNWKFKDEFKPEYITQEEYGTFETVHIPHTVRETPYDCFDEFMCGCLSTYVRFFDLPVLGEKRVAVEFEGVATYYDLYVNGQKAGSHKGAYSIALFDITEYVHEGQNKLMLMVDSNTRPDIPPEGATVDYLLYGGIYRDVTLYVLEPAYVLQDLFRYTLEGEQAVVCPELMIQNTGEAFQGEALVEVSKDGDTVGCFRREIQVEPGLSHVTLAEECLPKIERWELDAPVLYDVQVTLLKNGRSMDEHHTRVGFRTTRVDAKGFYLNDRKVKLIGLNRHQSYPYVGYAMGKRPQQKDADILKTELGLNTARCSHYMQSKYFLDRCDEIGLMVFEEVPGWGYLGDEAYKDISRSDLRNMVLGHFNHPSIIIWGTRLNESPDDDVFYEEMNRLCKEMDPTRPTSGVRWHMKSTLLEDIYSYNDYTPPCPRDPDRENS